MPSHSPFPFPANAIVPLALISPLNETRCGRNRFRVVDVEENKKKKMRLLRVVLCAYNASIARVCVLWILHLRLAERTTTTGSYARLTQFSCCNECNPRFYRGASRNRASKLLSHDDRYSLLTWSFLILLLLLSHDPQIRKSCLIIIHPVYRKISLDVTVHQLFISFCSRLVFTVFQFVRDDEPLELIIKLRITE